MKFLLKVVVISGKNRGKHYYVRPGGYITPSCETNEPDYCYYRTAALAESAKKSFEEWNAWYYEHYPHVSDKKLYHVCRVE